MYLLNKIRLMQNKSIISILILALTAFYCILPLVIRHGLPDIDDMAFHVFQAAQFDKAINEGFLYPRWVPDSNNGYGSANFVFYAPLSYYFVSAIKFIAPSLIVSMITAIWCSFFFSGITMFIATTRIFGRSGSFLSAVIYQILPLHVRDLYVRGTFAELFAFAWFPLIILFLHESLGTKNRKALIGLSISYAGLILTHLVSGFIFSIVIGAYLIYNYFALKDKKRLLQPLLSLALGLGLSSLYLIPVIFERKFVQIEYIVNCPICDYKKNFLFTLDKFQAELSSFYLPLHIGVVLEVILFIFIVALIYNNRQRISNIFHLKFFLLLFLSAFLLSTPLSRPLWDIIPGFSFLQFPWRWVTIMELSLCLMIGAICAIEDMSGPKSATMGKRAIIYLIIALSLVSFNTILKGSDFISNIKATTLNVREYSPVWATNMKEIMSKMNNERISTISGDAASAIITWKSEKRIIRVTAFAPSLLRISTFYYPGWTAYMDGVRTEIKTEEGTDAMLIDVPRGKHALELKFEDTPVRFYSRIISVAALFIMLVMGLPALFFVKKKHSTIKE